MRSRAVDIAERVVWTFVQSFIGSLPVTISLTSRDLRAVALSGLAAGIAAVVALAKNLTTSPGLSPVP